MATNTFVRVLQPAHKAVAESGGVRSRPPVRFGPRYAPRLSRQDSQKRRWRKTLWAISPDPQPKLPRARECGASIRRKERDRADSPAEEGPIGFPAEREARIQFVLVRISILDYETNCQSTASANLF
jgi:hypothetical protein